MTMLKRLRPSPALAVAALALLLALGGTSYATNDKQAKKAHAKFYGAQQWLPGDSEVGYAGVFIGSRVCTSSPYSEGNAGFGQPIDLPDGAEITKVTFYYSDTDPEEEFTFSVGSQTVGVADVVEEFPQATSSTTDPPSPETNPGVFMQSVDVIPTAPVVVDNTDRRYSVGAEFSACGTSDFSPEDTTWLVLEGVRVHYTLK